MAILKAQEENLIKLYGDRTNERESFSQFPDSSDNKITSTDSINTNVGAANSQTSQNTSEGSKDANTKEGLRFNSSYNGNTSPTRPTSPTQDYLYVHRENYMDYQDDID